MTANDRHAIPPFPPSHATVPSPDKLSQHTFQFVDAQRLFRDQFVALVDDELRLGELRKRILRFRCRRLRIIAHKIMMPNDAQVIAVHPLAVAAVSFLLLFPACNAPLNAFVSDEFRVETRLAEDGGRRFARIVSAHDFDAEYLHMTSMRKLSAYRICDALTLSTAGRLAKYARSFAVNFPSTILPSPYIA